MPLAQGTIGIPDIYNGSDKIGSIYKGSELVYQSYVYNPVIALIERTIENVDTELTSEITEIGVGAFRDCSTLTSITIPDTITTLWDECFSGCSSLKYFQMPSSVTTIGIGAFRDCINLTNINIPYGIAIIPSYIFYNCISLTNITIPSSVTKINNNAFYGCSKLTEMRIEATTPPQLTNINDISTATKTIYVPAYFLSDYKSAIYWKDLLTRETNPVTFVGY